MQPQKLSSSHQGVLFFMKGAWEMPETDVARIQEQIKTLFGDVAELKCDIKEIRDNLVNRLPLWATMLISLLVGICGWLIGR